MYNNTGFYFDIKSIQEQDMYIQYKLHEVKFITCS